MKNYSVYWRTASRQLFSFRLSVAAMTGREARQDFKRRREHRDSRVVGVKELAACGRRTAQGGRWVA